MVLIRGVLIFSTRDEAEAEVDDPESETVLEVTINSEGMMFSQFHNWPDFKKYITSNGYDLEEFKSYARSFHTNKSII